MPHVSQFSRSQRRLRLWVWGTAFTGFFSWAVYYAHGVQIQNTPLFKGVLFTLRQDAKVKRYIGTDLQVDWKIFGWINHIKGRADIDFEVNGSQGKGKVHLEALRYMEDWYVKVLTVNVAGEDIVHVEPHGISGKP